MRIGVIGGGFTGLACAHYLLKAGHTPVVFEAGPQLGGLAAHFVHNGVAIDRTPHALLDTDSAVCGLMADLGALGQLSWKETRRGLVANRRVYPWESTADLLRFDAVRLDTRVRAGLVSLYLTRGRRYGLDLDAVPAWDWLQQLFGASFFERVWAPLLRAQFGDHATEAPAFWAWKMLNRHMRGDRELRGYIRGGFGWLTDQLHTSIDGRGGEVRLQSAVKGVQRAQGGIRIEAEGREETFDAVVATLPIPQLLEITRGGLRAELPSASPDYQGVRSTVVVSRSRLERFYTTSVTDDDLSFHTVVESTHVVPASCAGGYHLIYLLNRSGVHGESQALADDVVKKQAIEDLTSIYPHFDPLGVEDIYVFRNPQAAPIWTVGYLHRVPGFRVGDSRLYLCSDAQAYPRIPGWDSSVALSREIAAKISADLS